LLQVNEVLASLHLGDETLRRVMALMLKEMEKGLQRDGTSCADIKMLPSFVCAIPNGHEHGQFLALDLGGTNFRVLLISLENGNSEMSSKIFRIPHEIMVGSGVLVCRYEFFYSTVALTKDLTVIRPHCCLLGSVYQG